MYFQPFIFPITGNHPAKEQFPSIHQARANQIQFCRDKSDADILAINSNRKLIKLIIRLLFRIRTFSGMIRSISESFTLETKSSLNFSQVINSPSINSLPALWQALRSPPSINIFSRFVSIFRQKVK